MQKVVIDLEMCRLSGKAERIRYHYSQEIIQIGAVLLDEGYQEISRFSTYVKPEFGTIDQRIAKLTGIHNYHVKKAPYLKDALIMLSNWLGGKMVEFYTWSSTDYTQLEKEMGCKQLCVPEWNTYMSPEIWHDYQKIFGRRFSFKRCVALKEALELADLSQIGQAHDGLMDSINTGRLIAKLELHPEYQLNESLRKAREGSVEPLRFSLGDIFTNMCLEGVLA